MGEDPVPGDTMPRRVEFEPKVIHGAMLHLESKLRREATMREAIIWLRADLSDAELALFKKGKDWKHALAQRVASDDAQLRVYIRNLRFWDATLFEQNKALDDMIRNQIRHPGRSIWEF